MLIKFQRMVKKFLTWIKELYLNGIESWEKQNVYRFTLNTMKKRQRH